MIKFSALRTFNYHCFFKHFSARIQDERIHITSGYLAYVSLMSLVPLMVVMFSIMTAFPLFADVKDNLENFVYNHFMPASGEAIQDHISGFVVKASQMSVIALSFLFLFALMLMSAIDKSLNHIWKIRKKRSFITSFSMYWLILTLGPILISLSLALSSYLLTMMSTVGVGWLNRFFLAMLPFFISMAAFYLLYLAVPNKKVPMRFALLGAFLAALLFEIAKKSFALYVLKLQTYQAIYGALAGIPILFLWVYMSWLIVLTGAVFTVSLQECDEQNAARESDDEDVS